MKAIRMILAGLAFMVTMAIFVVGLFFAFWVVLFGGISGSLFVAARKASRTAEWIWRSL